MSPEITPERRLAKSARRRVRKQKRGIRQKISVTQPSPDTTAWHSIEEILRMKLPNYDQDYASYSVIFQEFSEIRRKITYFGESLNSVKEFQSKYDAELLKGLAPVFIVIREVVGKPR